MQLSIQNICLVYTCSSKFIYLLFKDQYICPVSEMVEPSFSTSTESGVKIANIDLTKYTGIIPSACFAGKDMVRSWK